jgi:hypothetical protein
MNQFGRRPSVHVSAEIRRELMWNVLEFLGDRKHRKATIALLAIGATLVIVALIVGIADNLPGILLLYLGVAAFILAFAHGWHRARSFQILLLVSVIGVPVFAVLHNVMYALANMMGGVVLLRQVFQFLHASCFLLALIVCPPGILIGAVGSLVVFFRHRARTPERS